MNNNNDNQIPAINCFISIGDNNVLHTQNMLENGENGQNARIAQQTSQRQRRPWQRITTANNKDNAMTVVSDAHINGYTVSINIKPTSPTAPRPNTGTRPERMIQPLPANRSDDGDNDHNMNSNHNHNHNNNNHDNDNDNNMQVFRATLPDILLPLDLLQLNECKRLHLRRVRTFEPTDNELALYGSATKKRRLNTKPLPPPPQQIAIGDTINGIITGIMDGAGIQINVGIFGTVGYIHIINAMQNIDGMQRISLSEMFTVNDLIQSKLVNVIYGATGTVFLLSIAHLSDNAYCPNPVIQRGSLVKGVIGTVMKDCGIGLWLTDTIKGRIKYDAKVGNIGIGAVLRNLRVISMQSEYMMYELEMADNAIRIGDLIDVTFESENNEGIHVSIPNVSYSRGIIENVLESKKCKMKSGDIINCTVIRIVGNSNNNKQMVYLKVTENAGNDNESYEYEYEYEDEIVFDKANNNGIDATSDHSVDDVVPIVIAQKKNKGGRPKKNGFDKVKRIIEKLMPQLIGREIEYKDKFENNKIMVKIVPAIPDSRCANNKKNEWFDALVEEQPHKKRITVNGVVKEHVVFKDLICGNMLVSKRAQTHIKDHLRFWCSAKSK